MDNVRAGGAVLGTKVLAKICCKPVNIVIVQVIGIGVAPFIEKLRRSTREIHKN